MTIFHNWDSNCQVGAFWQEYILNLGGPVGYQKSGIHPRAVRNVPWDFQPQTIQVVPFRNNQ